MERVLTDFVKALRNANVRVSPAETLDAMEVVDRVGYENKDLLKRTLSIVLPKTPEEKDKLVLVLMIFLQMKLRLLPKLICLTKTKRPTTTLQILLRL